MERFSINQRIRQCVFRPHAIALPTILLLTSVLPANAALIDLDLRLPLGSNYTLTQNIPVEVWFVGDTSPGVDWTSADLIFEWGAQLSYSSYADEPIPNLFSGTVAKNPPENGIIWSGGTLADPLSAASGGGTHVTTLNLKADQVGTAIAITIIEFDDKGPTVVLDEMTETTGTLDSVEVNVDVPEPVTVLSLAISLAAFCTRKRMV